jgi:hypothetical protein
MASLAKPNLPTEKFCPECGCDVKLDSVKTQPCRECQVLVVGHTFCSNCSWKIDPAIFKGMFLVLVAI